MALTVEQVMETRAMARSTEAQIQCPAVIFVSLKMPTTNRFVGPNNELLLNPLHRGDSVTIGRNFVKTSYGVNGAVKRFDTEGNKILALDYNKPVADVVGPDAIGIFFWDADAAPRHLGGTLNVVFFDGHIETQTADEINPCVPWLHNLYWSPETMPIIPVPF